MKFRSVQDQPIQTKSADLPSTNPDSYRSMGLAISNGFRMSNPMKSVQVLGERGRNLKGTDQFDIPPFFSEFFITVVDFR